MTALPTTVLDALPASVAVVDHDGAILAVNERWRAFAAASPPSPPNAWDNANYLEVCDTARGDDAPQAAAFATGLRRVLAGDTALFEAEYPCHAPPRLRWFIARVTPLTLGRRRGAVIVHEDITTRVSVERALRDMLAGAAVAGGGEGFLRGLTHSLAGSLAARCAFVAELLPGQARLRTIAVWAGNAFADNYDYDLAGTPCEQALRHGLFVVSDGAHSRFPGDARLQATRSASYAGAALVDADGRTLGVIGFLDDLPVSSMVIVESVLPIFASRASAELARMGALHRSDATYRDLVEHATYGIYQSRIDGRFLTVNRALVEVLGYATPEELMAVELRDLYVRLADREHIIERIDREGRISRVETEWKRKDGSPIGVALSGRVRRADDGAITGFEIIVEDVTARRDLEAQLRQAQKMEAVGQLAGGVAHDFNNLLTTIMVTTEMIQEQFPADSPLRAESDLVLRASQNAADLTRKLLTFGRRRTLDLQPLLLADAVEELVALARRVIPADIELVTRVRDLHAVVRADRTALEQVLMNLVTNARDAMPGGGTLTITVDRQTLDDDFHHRQGWGEPGDYATTTVSDTGCGMDAETVRRVFEPFFTTKALGAGTGLGMAMVWGLVKQQHGYVIVDSEPGGGTAVTIFLPVTGGATAERLVAHQRPVGGTETILIAEDEPYIRQTIQRVLSRQGYRVLLASDGLEALERFDQHREEIRLLISDVVMPRMGGVDLVARLRERRPQLKVLLTSGYMGRDLERLRAADGTIPMLAKPWTVTDLLATVRTILDAPERVSPAP